MADWDPKGDLHRYLQIAREAVLWKLEGLSEYDVRRPLVPTGTNLLGLVKHMATGPRPDRVTAPERRRRVVAGPLRPPRARRRGPRRLSRAAEAERRTRHSRAPGRRG